MEQKFPLSRMNSNLPFAEYIQIAKDHIKAHRKDLTPQNTKTIVAANSPFEMKPEGPIRAGVLLIHGLYDSPFSVRDCATHLVSQGYWVRAILLPGHGTQAKDLFHISYQDWTATVSYGVKSLQKEVEKVFLLGFSLGGTLALHEAYCNPNIAGLLLFAPGIKSIRKYAKYAPLLNWLGQFIKPLKWYQQNPQKSYAKYESYSSNAAAQALRLMKVLQKEIHTPLKLPIFMVTTVDDETICVPAAYHFFKAQPNSKNRFIVYTTENNYQHDPKVSIRTSTYPEERIIDFSHVCLLISPQNSHYGRKGDYHDIHFIHSSFDEENNFYLGAETEKNLKKYSLQRLTYNPDFDWLMQEIDIFLKNTNVSSRESFS